MTLDIRCCMLGKMFNKELTMARPLRFEYKGALYHVLARGNERREIFFTDTDLCIPLKSAGDSDEIGTPPIGA